MEFGKKELNWGSYQDKQLKALESISQTLDLNVRTSAIVRDNLLDIATSLNSLAKAFGKDFNPNITNAGKSLLGITNSYANAVKGHIVLANSYGAIIEDLTEAKQKELKAIQDAEDAKKKQAEDDKLRREAAIKNLQLLESKISNFGIYYLRQLGRSTEKYSDLSDTLMKSTGASRYDVDELRNTIANSIVKQLNADTRNFFNSQEAYSTMVTIAGQVGLGNVEAIEKLARPILIASESTDMNIGQLSKLLNKWSIRSNMSSVTMEILVDQIRNSTSNNMATTASVLSNIETLEKWITKYSAGNDEVLLAMTQSISDSSAWIESMGLSSDRYTSYIDEIIKGNAYQDTQLLTLLNEVGLTVAEAQDIARSTDIGSLYEYLFEAEASLLSEWEKNSDRLLGIIAKEYSMNIDDMEMIAQAASSSNYKTRDQFISGIDRTVKATDTIAEQFTTVEERISNQLSGIAATVADISETLGIGLSDIAGAWLLSRSAVDIITNISKISGKNFTLLDMIAAAFGIKGTTATVAGGTAVAGGGSAAAGVLGSLGSLAAILAAVLGVANSIYDIIEEKQSRDRESYNRTVDSAGNIVEGQGVGVEKTVSVDSKGNVTTSYRMVAKDKSTIDTNADKAIMKEQYEKDMKDYKTEWDNPLTYLGMITGTGGEYDKWYKFIPFIGNAIQNMENEIGRMGTSSNYNKELAYYDKINNFTSDELRLYTAYRSQGLINDVKKREFLLDNWDKFYALNTMDPPMAAEISKKGLKTPIDRLGLLGYKKGTNYITEDSVVVVHEGESITPKQYNPSANKNELEVLRDRYSRDMEKDNKSANEMKQLMNDAIVTMKSIQEFLVYWQEDNNTREDRKLAMSRYESISNKVAAYMSGG